MAEMSLSLQVKLAGVIAHVREATAPGRSEYDIHAAKSSVDDPEVREWMVVMELMGFVPLARDGFQWSEPQSVEVAEEVK